MNNLTIKTNNQYREILMGYDVPEQYRDDFDYMDNIDENMFFKYKGQYYALDQFMVGTSDREELEGFHGIHNATYFSGVLIKLSDCGDMVQVASYHC